VFPTQKHITPAMHRASKKNAAIARKFQTPESHRVGGLAANRGRKMKWWHKHKWEDPAYRRKNLKARRTKKYRRTKSRQAKRQMKRQWKEDKKYVRKMMKVLRKTHHPSKTSGDFCRRLRKVGIRGLKREYPVGRRRIDIACPRLKMAIELDGIKWHPKKNQKRDRFLRRLGWKVFHVRFKGCQIKERDFRRIYRRLTEL
jgi:very-short-patch-repair endonuclease